MSKTDIIIEAMKIDVSGISPWWDIAELEKITGISLRGNGSPYFQKDRGVGLKYIIEKDMLGTNKLQKVRTVGAVHTTNRQVPVPKEIKAFYTGKACVFCGTYSQIEIDHKDGTREPCEYPCIVDFQPVCGHCNKVKRERCKECRVSGKRFDARLLGFVVGWVRGRTQFSPSTIRCVGCYWHDPNEFRKQTIEYI